MKTFLSCVQALLLSVLICGCVGWNAAAVAQLSWTEKPAAIVPAVKPVPPGDSPSDYPDQKWVAVEYKENAPEFVPTDAETQRGYALFSRPLIDPIYPTTQTDK